MALYIRLRPGSQVQSLIHPEWVQNIPFGGEYIGTLNRCGQYGYVDHIYASGDEKQYILARFENLPTTKGDSCFWVGDMANFICANLT